MVAGVVFSRNHVLFPDDYSPDPVNYFVWVSLLTLDSSSVLEPMGGGSCKRLQQHLRLRVLYF